MAKAAPLFLCCFLLRSKGVSTVEKSGALCRPKMDKSSIVVAESNLLNSCVARAIIWACDWLRRLRGKELYGKLQFFKGRQSGTSSAD